MTRAVAILLMWWGLVASGVAAPGGPSKNTVTVSFNGTDFVHRWSQKGQNEFTPAGEEDLSAWKSMVTIDVHDEARDGDQLAQVANQVLGRYQATGRVLRTDSKPRTKDHEAEHFVSVIFPQPTLIEVAFARLLLADKRGVVVVYSHRVYGAKAGDQMSAWLEKNGPHVEKALMAWDGLPSLAALQALQAVEKAAPPQGKSSPEAPGVAPRADREGAEAELKAIGYDPGSENVFIGAARKGDAELVRLYLAAGMRVDSPNSVGQHALQAAIQGGYTDLAAELLTAGANPKLADKWGGTALIELAAYCDDTKLLAAFLKAGADAKAETETGLTALQNANLHGCTQMTRVLKQAGALK